MRSMSQKCRSTLIFQIMLAHIHATYSIHILPRDYLQYDRRNLANYRFMDPSKKEIDYNLQDLPMEEEETIFSRKIKSGNQPRTFSIDLSQLRQDTPMAHSTSRHKSPMNLLSIDISALSRNPDPSLPIASKQSKDKVNGKYIMAYDFDPRFDRLPIAKTKPMRIYSSIPQDVKGKALLPMMNLPLKVMTAYHSTFNDKKHDIDFELNDRNQSDAENEQKYTANFILHLLYQLSSNFRRVANN